MNVPHLKHPKSAQALHSAGSHHSSDLAKQKEDVERLEDEFLSIASHELRTPLTAIRGNTSMIRQYYWDKLPDDDVKAMISDVHESSTRLISLVDDLLDILRLEQKSLKLKFEDFNILDIINETERELKNEFIQNSLSLELKQPQEKLPVVRGDQKRAKQVLCKLVKNALRYTQNGGVVIAVQPGHGFVKVLVSDSGQGIPRENQKLLFKRFEHAGGNMLTRDSRSTGLGLYMCRMLMDQMGGHIQLESSEPGKGTTFSFTLPLE